MNAFFHFVLKNRVTISVLTLSLMIFSALSLQDLAVDAVPDISSQQVVINTKTGSLSTEQIEKVVTFPIETELGSVPRVKELRSLTKYGLSQVVVVFEEPIDLYWARQQVSERLSTLVTQLPDGVTPELAPMSTGLGEVLMWTLGLTDDSPYKQKTEKEQLQYLRWIQETQVRPSIKRVPGVAEVDTNGGHNSEVHINFTPEKLKKAGLSTNDILQAVESLGVTFSGGYIKKQGQHITVAAHTDTQSLTDIRNFIIKIYPNGRALRLGEVARVEIDSALRVGAATHDGRETVLGTVLMRTGENSRKVASATREALAQIDLPKDIHLEILYNREYLVNSTIKTVVKNLLEGAALVILVLFFLLGHIRAATLVSLAIPLSMLMALKGMGLLKISANLMSLGAIDFGLLVDASVVMVENYLRRLQEFPASPSIKSKQQAIVESCAEVSTPVIFGLIIIMLVYVPILWLEGVEGKMFAPMAITVLMALAASLLVALVVVPILIYYFIPTESHGHEETRIFQKISGAYDRSLKWSFQHKTIVLSTIVILFVTSLLAFTQLGRDFVPQLDEGDMIIGLVRDPKQNIEESVKDQLAVEKAIAQYQEVEHVFSRLGTPESATDPMSPNFADTFLILKKDHNQWPVINGKRRTKEELFNAISEDLIKLNPNQEITATQPIEMRLNEVLEGSRADVSLRLIGPDLDTLLESAEKAETILADLQGLQSVEFDALTGLTKTPVIQLTVQSEKARQYDLTAQQIAEQLEIALAGRPVGQYFMDGRRIPVIFHLDEAIRDNIEVLKQLPIPLPNGGSFPLDQFATLQEEEKVTTIARRYSERYSALSLYLQDRDLGSFVAEAQDKIAKQLKLPPGYRAEWGGQFENLERAQKRLGILIPILLTLIFLMIIKVTGSWRQSLLIFSAVPLGLAGGIFALYFRDIRLSVSASIGFIALSGIVILNSVVLVTFINQLYQRGLSVTDAIQQGVESRLRPILMTASVASLGFLPMALANGSGAEVQRPLATVVIGGLLTSTFLTLYVIPILMVLWPKSLKK